MFYYFSIGSNINPKHNVGQIVHWLATQYQHICLLPVIETVPEDLETQQLFLNTLGVFYSSAAPMEIKLAFNNLEESLGRDRSDPDKSFKDRAADVDILHVSDGLNLELFATHEESYNQAVYKASLLPRVVSDKGLFFSNGTAAVYLDSASGEIGILDNEPNSLEDWLKSSLVSQ